MAQSYLDDYTSYDDMKRELKRLGVDYSVIGKSRAGNDIIVVRFGNDTDPGVFVLGNIDGDYLPATELSMRLIRDLKDNKIDRNGKTVFIVPMPNPDATERLLNAKVSTATSVNALAVDNDYDQRVNEDGHNDLNGDGIISQLRIADATGLYKPSDKNPALLLKVDPLKGGTGSYRVIAEGRDDDGDDKIDEDGFGGVNINRNFTYNYNRTDPEAGANQASEPESRALMDFVLDRPNILFTLNFSSFDNLHKNWRANPLDFADHPRPLRALETMMKEDAGAYKLFAEMWKADHQTWSVRADNRGEGTFHDWAYFHAGRWSIAVNAWNAAQVDVPGESGESSADSAEPSAGNGTKTSMTVAEKLYLDAQNKNLAGAVIPWTPINHPDFPGKKVEVGGFHSAYLNNPSVSVFAATESSAYVESLTTLFPALIIDRFEVNRLKGGIYRVTLELKNTGKLPTQSKMGAVSRWMYPVRVVWNLPKERFLSGTRKTLLESIDALGGTTKLEWLIDASGQGGAQLDIISPVIDDLSRQVKFGG